MRVRPRKGVSRSSSSLSAVALARAAFVGGLLFVFLVGVHGFGEGFKLLGGEALDSFFRVAENPFAGLMIGILATSIAQSSSVTTSLIVGLVAAPENALPLGDAVPMVMGANFGTTVTNSIVSLAHVGRGDEFRRAFAVSTCDDFFEILSASLLLPVELATGVLERSAMLAAGALAGVDGVEYRGPLEAMLDAGLAPLEAAAGALFGDGSRRGLFLVIVSGGLVFAALLRAVTALRGWLGETVKEVVSRALGASRLRGLAVGAATTAAVQSSSVTTSLLVPLAGSGILALEQAFPVVLGANIGTTVTAPTAALAASGPRAEAGVAIAIVHALYNLIGTAIFLPFAATRRLPLGCARWLADHAASSPSRAFLYVVLIFYGVPALFAWIYE